MDAGQRLYAYDADSFRLLRDCEVLEAYHVWSDAAPAPACGGYFDMLGGITSNGNFITLFDTEEGTAVDIMSPNVSSMCAIAYLGTGEADYTGVYGDLYPDCPANFYYVVTADGELWRFDICAALLLDRRDSACDALPANAESKDFFSKSRKWQRFVLQWIDRAEKILQSRGLFDGDPA